MEIFCVKCKKPLPEEPAAENKTCPQCGHQYRNNGEYLDLLQETGLYWGEIPKDDLQKLIAVSEKTDYRKTCFQYFKDHPRQNLFYYIVNEGARISFLNFIYQKKSAGTCLDVGSGYGAIPAGLSKKFKFVYSLEFIKERVAFQALRKKQDRIANWQIIQGGIRELPFPDDYFDFVSVNGVLEWAAVADFSDTPRNVQLRFLKEIKRVLKPSGICYVGIENRTGLPYFRGALDHSGLKYTSLVPRIVANALCWFFSKQKDNFFYNISKKKPVGLRHYRLNTYTKRGYQKLLREIGIKKVRIFHGGLSYDYAYDGIDDRSIRYVPLARGIMTLSQFRYSYAKLLAKMFSWLSPTFLIFFGKESADLVSDTETAIARDFSDAGPIYIHKGINSLMAYSMLKKTFYRIAGDKIRSEGKIEGTIPKTVDPNLFERILQKIKKEYYERPSSNPEKFDRIRKKILDCAQRYDFDAAALQKYLAYMKNKYGTRSFFSQTHGDIWSGNIIITPDQDIKFIDEEEDAFGLMPVDVTRFLLSVVGYDKEPERNEYMDKIEKTFSRALTCETVKDFYLLSLFFELMRRDYLEGNPNKATYLFAERITNWLRQHSKNFL